MVRGPSVSHAAAAVTHSRTLSPDDSQGTATDRVIPTLSPHHSGRTGATGGKDASGEYYMYDGK
ncbi:hypothetical protein E2C01_085016 [Portunus trituberculatus]|uniref:Uncharacterized protein n=1 Tax=Portunus trituberculatus TaxID=210409 RepID=A0A5B7J5M9_PORTR|nr:hypothetical protein [Portunus trituberculatus]